MTQKYPTQEKLKQKREIDLLFAKGRWLSQGNLRIIYLDLSKNPQEEFELVNQKVGVSVSKKFFKRAVDRNRIKRLLREAYRLNKEMYLDHFGSQSISMIFWITKTPPESYQSLAENFVTLCKSKK